MTLRGPNGVNYGNWVSTRIILFPMILALLSAALAFLSIFLLIPAAIFLLVAGYFAYARFLFSPKGANVQERIHSLILDRLDWNGEGKVLDIGCGSAALTIQIAKKFPDALVVGTDSWGGNWQYSQKLCQANALKEHVDGHVTFQKASACRLPFSNEHFDAVVSNLVFHEVKDTPDKIGLVKEALRILKKGGKFALQDLFYIDRLFGRPEDLVTTIRNWGIKKIDLIDTKNSSFIPVALKLPFIVGTLGLIIGEK